MNYLPIDQQITFLYTSNLKTSANFYEVVMGFKLALDQGSCRLYQTALNSYLGICERENVESNPNCVIFTLVTSDVDGWYVLLKKKGIVFENPPVLNSRYQIYHCFLRDPNGYLIEIQRFEDPRWLSEA